MILQRDFEVGTMSAATFFGDVCARLLRAKRTVLPEQGGRFGFVVRGRHGGRWTLDLNQAAVVARVNPDDTDVCIEIDYEDFQSLLRGSLDVRASFSRGRLVVTGERARLAVLPHLLS